MPPVSPAATTTTTTSSLTRVKVVGAKSSKQAIARYRLLDLDADDDDDDDTDDDADDDAGPTWHRLWRVTTTRSTWTTMVLTQAS